MRPHRIHIHRVQRLAGGHEQAIAARASEADIGAVFRQADHADRLAGGCDDLHSGGSAGPHIAIDIATDAVGCAALELHETLAVAQCLAVEIVDANLAAGAGVADVDLFVVGRKQMPFGWLRSSVTLSIWPVLPSTRYTASLVSDSPLKPS